MRIDWEKYDKKKAEEIAKRFGTAVVTEMMFSITRLSLVDKGNLLRSVKATVRSQQGEVNRVQFSYAYYGRFLENGAKNVFGKGVTLQPQQWRNPAIAFYKPELDREFSEYYAQLILGEIVVESVQMEM